MFHKFNSFYCIISEAQKCASWKVKENEREEQKEIIQQYLIFFFFVIKSVNMFVFVVCFIYNYN